MTATPKPGVSNIPHSTFAIPPSLIDWLSNPAAYPEHTASVQRVETHISCVFLTDQFAYKLKKPVRFDFVDFSTIELRLRACEEELRLNRRLAPDVYLGLVAVRNRGDGEFFLDEDGSKLQDDAIDWLVKMRRLPNDATLLAKVQSQAATDADTEAIAVRLAEFYRQAQPLPIEPGVYRAEIERHVLGNRAELLNSQHGLDEAAIEQIHAAQLRLLHLRPALFDDRVRAGHIVDGHGDLRPEHIYLLAASGHSKTELVQPAVIDCIEFSAEFRHLDVADELSFLATECDFIGAESLGRHIFERTAALLNDRPPPVLVAFYRSYRACVRAKVAALRAKQQNGDDRAKSLGEARRRLQWAEQYNRQLPSPSLTVVCGLMGSGKSTLAAQLSERLGATVLSTDTIRREVFGKGEQSAAYGAGNYRTENRRQVYDEMFRRAGGQLEKGLSVILDGAFLAGRLRTEASKLAAAANLPFAIVHCHCPSEVARQRIAARLAGGASDSEARPDFFEQQRAEEEPLPAALEPIEVDTTLPIEWQIELALGKLRQLP